MEASKKYLASNKIIPFISFKSQPEHTVKLIDDKEDSIMTQEGKQDGMKYLVEEDGTQKSFFTTSISLVQQLANFNKGDEVTIKLGSKKVDGQFRSSYTVRKKGESSDPEVESLEEAASEAPSW